MGRNDSRALGIGFSWLALLVVVAACSSSSNQDVPSAPVNIADSGMNGGDANSPAGPSDASTTGDANGDDDATADGGGPCTTRISYGAAWIAPANHPANFDDVPGVVRLGRRVHHLGR